MSDQWNGTAHLCPRFAVTELEGFDTRRAGKLGTHSKPGLSVQVLDRLRCYRIVWQRQSEDYGANTDRAKDFLRHEAHRVCARLNGAPEPEPFARWRSHFRPTCPSCGALAAPTEAYCPSCHVNLYRQERRGAPRER